MYFLNPFTSLPFYSRAEAKMKKRRYLWYFLSLLSRPFIYASKTSGANIVLKPLIVLYRLLFSSTWYFASSCNCHPLENLIFHFHEWSVFLAFMTNGEKKLKAFQWKSSTSKVKTFIHFNVVF